MKKLGYKIEQAGAHALVLTGTGPRPHAIAVMLDEREAFDANSQRFTVSPVAYGLGMAERQGVPWLIILRGTQVRLYPARIDLGVGRKGLAETFCEVDLPQLTLDNAGYLSLIFSASALEDGGTAHQIMKASSLFAVALGERLREKVYDDIIPDLALAVADQLMEQNYEMDAEGLDLAYQLTLRIFFRLLFQVYAEDRRLLPFGENARYDRNALKTVALDLVDDPDQEFDENSTSLWDDLAQVWRVIDSGDRAWGVPAYNGGLFTTDAEYNPHGAIINTIRIGNAVMGPILKALLLDEGDDGTAGPIDFRSLSVREFGTIYEGLLESSLGLAEVDLTLDDKQTWVPAKNGDEVWATAGQVYFHNTSGQRKGTGSYFTPSFVVEHLLERSLDPALDEHLAKVAELAKTGDQAGAHELFFDFRVADLAMGSGHFLTSAIDHIEAKMAAFLADESIQIPGVAKELTLLAAAAKEKAGPDSPDPEPSSLLRRQIARRCIYGLDINPIAVELARVSIWIHTFVRGLPMSSLDHNLVCANSLTGIGNIDEALDVLVPDRAGGAMTLFDDPIKDALGSARTVLVDVANMLELDRDESRAASKAVAKAHKVAEKAKLLFDAAVLTRIGRGNMVLAFDPDSIAKLASESQAQAVLEPLLPAHMPVLFPEVFLRENGGFDVLIGNPPWDKVRHEPTQFWVQKSPGLNSVADRESEIEQLRLKYPLIAAEEDREIAAREMLRKAVDTHFKLQGTGHHELSKYFLERNLQLLALGGALGLVLPGAFCSLGGWKELRLGCLQRGKLAVTQGENRGGYLFASVHQQTSVAMVALCSGEPGNVSVTPGMSSMAQFESGSNVAVDISGLVDPSGSCQIPWVGSATSALVLSRISMLPTLGGGDGWVSGEPESQWDFSASGRHHSLATSEHSKGSWSVLMARHVEPFAVSDQGIQKFVPMTEIQALADSGLLELGEGSGVVLPPSHPRIVYRFPSSSTNTRTLIAALLPESGFLYSTGYAHGIRLNGNPNRETVLCLLAVMNSIPADWWARKYVDRHVGVRIIRTLPIPGIDSENRSRLAALAMRMVLRQSPERFRSSFEEYGLKIDQGPSDDESLAEIDARVAVGYSLSRDQVIHIFETFHRGWDYQPRLTKVLEFFDAIEVTA